MQLNNVSLSFIAAGGSGIHRPLQQKKVEYGAEYKAKVKRARTVFFFFCGLEYAGGSVYVAGCGAKSVVVWGALKQPRYLSLSLHLFLSLLLSLSLPIPLTPLSLLILYVIPIDFLLLDTQSVDNFCLSSLSLCPPSCHGFMSRWGPGKDGP